MMGPGGMTFLALGVPDAAAIRHVPRVERLPCLATRSLRRTHANTNAIPECRAPSATPSRSLPRPRARDRLIRGQRIVVFRPRFQRVALGRVRVVCRSAAVAEGSASDGSSHSRTRVRGPFCGPTGWFHWHIFRAVATMSQHGRINAGICAETSGIRDARVDTGLEASPRPQSMPPPGRQDQMPLLHAWQSLRRWRAIGR